MYMYVRTRVPHFSPLYGPLIGPHGVVAFHSKLKHYSSMREILIASCAAV